MPISSPGQCRDHSVDWFAYFDHRRGREILDMIDEQLIEEHSSNPLQGIGHHSATLQIVLNYFRNAPIIGKEFVYVVNPYKEYRVGVVTLRGEAAGLLNDNTYSSEEQAVHAVFMARVDKLHAAQKGK